MCGFADTAGRVTSYMSFIISLQSAVCQSFKRTQDLRSTGLISSITCQEEGTDELWYAGPQEGNMVIILWDLTEKSFL